VSNSAVVWRISARSRKVCGEQQFRHRAVTGLLGCRQLQQVGLGGFDIAALQFLNRKDEILALLLGSGELLVLPVNPAAECAEAEHQRKQQPTAIAFPEMRKVARAHRIVDFAQESFVARCASVGRGKCQNGLHENMLAASLAMQGRTFQYEG
jgi:hypothetical protein